MKNAMIRKRLALGLATALFLSTSALPAFADGPKVLKKVPPEFPLEATRFKVSEGVVKAKVSIDGAGSVTDVTVIENTPPKAKVFNESAIAALTKWKFEGSGKGETTEIKLVFSQE